MTRAVTEAHGEVTVTRVVALPAPQVAVQLPGIHEWAWPRALGGHLSDDLLVPGRPCAALQGNAHGYWDYTAQQLEAISQPETHRTGRREMAERGQNKTFSLWSQSEDSYSTRGHIRPNQELCFISVLISGRGGLDGPESDTSMG